MNRLGIAIALGLLSTAARGDSHKLPRQYRATDDNLGAVTAPRLCGDEFHRAMGPGPRIQRFRVPPYVVESWVVFFYGPDTMPDSGAWTVTDEHGTSTVIDVESRYDPGSWVLVHIPDGDPALLHRLARLQPVKSIQPNCSTRSAIAVDEHGQPRPSASPMVDAPSPLQYFDLISELSCPSRDGLEVTRPHMSQLIPPSDDDFQSHPGSFTALASIRADIAWKNRATGSGITIAIVDPQVVDCHHNDLVGRMVDLRPHLEMRSVRKKSATRDCAVLDCTTGRECVVKARPVDSARPHGTEMAGIAAAEAGNGIGFRGVAPQARFLPVLVAGLAEPTKDDHDRLARAILDSVVRHGAKVISLSISIAGGEPEGVVAQAIEMAGARGALVVAAGGDEKRVGLYRPAAFDISNLLPVVGVEETDRWSDPSNCDPDRVAIAAPVQCLATTQPDQKDFVGNLATSGATALVAGAAAAVWSHPDYRHLSPVELKQVLIDNARGCPALEPWIKLGRVLDLSFLNKDFKAATKRWACGVQ